MWAVGIQFLIKKIVSAAKEKKSGVGTIPIMHPWTPTADSCHVSIDFGRLRYRNCEIKMSHMLDSKPASFMDLTKETNKTPSLFV
jgi:hypothetical protein